MPAERGPSPLVTNLLVGILCLIWGSTWLVIRGGLRDLPPLTSAGARFLLAGVVMIGVAATLGRREGGARPAAPLWATLGALNFALSYGIIYWTETVLPSGLVAVLWGVFPMLMAACGHLYLPGERLRGLQWAGFLGGFLGVVLLFLTDLRELGPEGLPAAAILLVSPVAAAVGTTAVKRFGGGTNSALLNRNGMLLGAALLLAAGRWREGDAAADWTPAALFSVAYLAIGGTVLTFGLYFWLLRYADAHRLSLIAYVTPAIALALGWAVGEEPVTRHTLLGSALILSGVVAVVRGKRAPRPAEAAEELAG